MWHVQAVDLSLTGTLAEAVAIDKSIHMDALFLQFFDDGAYKRRLHRRFMDAEAVRQMIDGSTVGGDGIGDAETG